MYGGKAPLEVLSGANTKTWLQDKYAPIAGGFFGFGGMCYANWGTGRPFLSGIQRHVVATVGLAALAMMVDKWRNAYFAEKDATLRHYIELHPEDFPTPERKKFAEVFEYWQPIR
ncbi:NADH dehydrogenase [ubiquinone] 1 subunit C2 [Toxorhynchites rutilus septentrionalis]|uniref:NADH dehydrogenase [ubiquinone] 1 subunit C2 n=1 Tax=Toxorhynchites rutilus septentrionalis TaxID=329112 RepID=UPI00247A3F08|nr:NADH dehydrogenase [ubiquinone] 1 subunit C2 [Toxorhynchites rutilus septentrionalis]